MLAREPGDHPEEHQEVRDQAQHDSQQPEQELGPALVTETDDILDEIDGILEENAEEYVRGFVQKGGQ